MTTFLKGLIPLFIVVLIGFLLAQLNTETVFHYIYYFEAIVGLAFAVIFYLLFRYDEGYNKFAFLIGGGYLFSAIMFMFFLMIAGSMRTTADITLIFGIAFGVIMYIPKVLIGVAIGFLLKEAIELSNAHATLFLIAAAIMLVISFFQSPTMVLIFHLEPFGAFPTFLFMIFINSYLYTMVTGTQALLDY